MELIDPLKGLIPARPTTVSGMIDPLVSAKQQVEAQALVGVQVAGYELGNLDVCPDCGEQMEQLEVNDILANVCIKHRVALPVKDKVTE